MLNVLSSVTRFFIVACTPPALSGEVVKRKKGYISFRHLENADKLAARLSARKPGTRFYVVKSVKGHCVPTTPASTSKSYS